MGRKRVEGEWRCSKCRHGENLTAWATTLVCGKLDPYGDVDWTDGEQTELHEESIQCRLHPGVHLERWFRGRWCREVPCDWSSDEYRGRTAFAGRYFFCERGQAGIGIGDARYGDCPNCHGNGTLWLPVAEAKRRLEAACPTR